MVDELCCWERVVASVNYSPEAVRSCSLVTPGGLIGPNLPLGRNPSPARQPFFGGPASPDGRLSATVHGGVVRLAAGEATLHFGDHWGFKGKSTFMCTLRWVGGVSFGRLAAPRGR